MSLNNQVVTIKTFRNMELEGFSLCAQYGQLFAGEGTNGLFAIELLIKHCHLSNRKQKLIIPPGGMQECRSHL
jgi:hypothetical protein